MIVNAALGGWYPQGQKRLYNSLCDNGYDGKMYFRRSEQFVNRYTFKPIMLYQALSMGTDYVIWMDASVWAVKNIQPIIDYIRHNDYLIFENGEWNTGQWINDKRLARFGIDRETSFSIPQCSSGVMGFNLTKPYVKDLLTEFYNLAIYEPLLFRGKKKHEPFEFSKDERVKGDRLDQSIISILLWQRGWLNWSNREPLWVFKNEKVTEETILIAHGL